ncbi:MAG: hypothetical protein JO332_04395 [Planctomycetaceae bacterium]|nr:hypothetical protein [Planctomycetaceae bacterium]
MATLAIWALLTALPNGPQATESPSGGIWPFTVGSQQLGGGISVVVYDAAGRYDVRIEDPYGNARGAGGTVSPFWNLAVGADADVAGTWRVVVAGTPGVPVSCTVDIRVYGPGGEEVDVGSGCGLLGLEALALLLLRGRRRR